MFDAGTEHGFPFRCKGPGVLRIHAAQLRPAAHVVDQRTGRAAGPVAHYVGLEDVQLVAVLLVAKIGNVRALQAVGPPDALERQVVPAGAVLVLQGAGTAIQGTGLGGRARAQLVFLVAVDTGGDFPVPHAPGVGLDRQAVHHMRQRFVADAKIGGRQVVAPAVDADIAAVNRCASGIAQVAFRAVLRRVVPVTQRVAGAHGG